MKAATVLTTALAVTQGASAAVAGVPATDVIARHNGAQDDSEFLQRSTEEELWKRKGGGGRGGGFSGGGGRSGSKGGSKGGSSGSSKTPSLGSTSSNVGGRTTTGSGPAPRYGAGGIYYPGGSSVPYQAGKTRKNLIPFFLLGSSVAFLGGAYIYGAWAYDYNYKYTFHNATTDKDESKPIECLCAAFETCTCEDNEDKSYYDSIIGNGSYASLNHSLVTVFDNETDPSAETKILIMGSVPNGTTASGGTEPPNAAGGLSAMLLQAAGWYPLVLTGLAFYHLA